MEIGRFRLIGELGTLLKYWSGYVPKARLKATSGNESKQSNGYRNKTTMTTRDEVWRRTQHLGGGGWRSRRCTRRVGFDHRLQEISTGRRRVARLVSFLHNVFVSPSTRRKRCGIDWWKDNSHDQMSCVVCQARRTMSVG